MTPSILSSGHNPSRRSLIGITVAITGPSRVPRTARPTVYPGNVTTSVDRAAAAIVRGLARRRTRVYIPRVVGIANWAKAPLISPAARPLLRRLAGEEVPALERQIEALGRSDQLAPVAEGVSASRPHAEA